MRMDDLTLMSARSVDGFIAELWHTMQAIPEYTGRTTFIITTDRGCGERMRWADLGKDVDGAEQIWIAAMGLGVPAAGDMRDARVTQAPKAATGASLPGEDFAKFDTPVARPLVLPR